MGAQLSNAITKIKGVRITAESAAGLFPGVMISDERGRFYRMAGRCGHTLTAHAIIDSRAGVLARAAVRFVLGPGQHEPIYDTGRDYDGEQRISRAVSSRQPAGVLA